MPLQCVDLELRGALHDSEVSVQVVFKFNLGVASQSEPLRVESEADSELNGRSRALPLQFA